MIEHLPLLWTIVTLMSVAKMVHSSPFNAIPDTPDTAPTCNNLENPEDTTDSYNRTVCYMYKLAPGWDRLPDKYAEGSPNDPIVACMAVCGNICTMEKSDEANQALSCSCLGETGFHPSDTRECLLLWHHPAAFLVSDPKSELTHQTAGVLIESGHCLCNNSFINHLATDIVEGLPVIAEVRMQSDSSFDVLTCT